MLPWQDFHGGGVYVITNDEGKSYKIGKTNNICRRMKTFKTAISPFSKIELHYIFIPVDDILYTSGSLYQIEHSIHKFYAENHIDGEFFKIDCIASFGVDVINYMANQHLKVKLALTPDDVKNISEPRGCVSDDDYEMNTGYDEPKKYVLPTAITWADLKDIIKFKWGEIRPKDYQMCIIYNIVNHFIKHTKGILELATGLGKTFVCAFYIKYIDRKKVLILTPSIEICKTIAKHFALCGIETDSIHTEADNVDVKFDKPVIMTYQSYLARREQIDKVNFDLVVYDEAHHIHAEKYILSLHIKSSRYLFMTATAKYVSKIQDVDDTEGGIVTMPCEIYGPMIHQIHLGDAIANGWLSNYRLFIHDMFVDELLYELFGKYMRRKVVLYYNSCLAAKRDLVRALRAGHNVIYVDSNMTTFRKQAALSQFENCHRPVAIFNVNILAEGVSYNDIDAVFFMEKRESYISIVQAIGRALRLSPTKAYAMVGITTKMDFDLYKNAMYALRQYDTRCCNPAMAICSNETIAVEAQKQNTLIEIDATGGTFMYKFNLCLEAEKEGLKIVERMNYKGYKIGDWLNEQRQKYKNDSNNKKWEQFKSLECWSEWLKKGRAEKKNTILPINKMIEYCVEAETNGIIITGRTIYKNIKLGDWIDRQRKLYKKDSKNDMWDDFKVIPRWVVWSNSDKVNYKKPETTDINKWITAYIAAEKLGPVINSTIYDNMKVGKWIGKQRHLYKLDSKNKKFIPMNQIPRWVEWCKNQETPKIRKKIYLEQMVALCVEAESKNIIITQSTIYNNIGIGSWLDGMKICYKESSNDERYHKLNVINYWVDWLNNYKNPVDKFQLCVAAEQEGITVADSTIYKDEFIGRWLTRERSAYRKDLNNEKWKKYDVLKCWIWYKKYLADAN